MKLARDIARGIKATHEISVIHRDIKPSNFFVSEHETYKLGDFNVSKKTEFAKTFAGTNGYLAPEIYAAKADADSHYTNQADIYSFGICLYQLMNDLYFPFEKEYDTDTAFDMRMKGTPLLPPTRASQAFAQIILKSCEFSEKARYRNMDEFLKDLDIAEGRIVLAPTPQPPPLVRRNIPTNQPSANPVPSFRPSKNGYVLNVKYIFNKQEWLRSLVSYDKRIVKFCNKLNEFLKIYHECYPLIDPNRFY